MSIFLFAFANSIIRYRLLAEVCSGRGPIFRIFHEISGNQSGVGICAGKYPYHTSTAADLPVQTFQHVGGRNLSCIQLWKSLKRQRVHQTVFQETNGFGKTVLVLSADFFSQPASLFSGGGQPDSLEILGKVVFVRNMRQNITHEMYGCSRRAAPSGP